MTFLIVFICCAAELAYVSFEPFRGGQWIVSWHTWLSRKVGLGRWLGRGSLFVSVALPCLLTAIIFNHVIVGSTVLSLLGGIAILLFCFGSGDLAREVEAYTSRYLDPEDGMPPPDKGGFLDDVGAIVGDPDRPYLRAIAIEANDGLFAPAFWFCVLGPIGALLFRMSSTLNRTLGTASAEAEIAGRLYNILIWLPARLLGVGLGLAGSLGPVIGILRQRGYDLSQSAGLLGDAAVAALDRQADDDSGDEHVASIGAMFGLVKRGFVVWLVVLALLAGAGLA